MLKDKEFQADAAKAYIGEMMKGDEEWTKLAAAALDKCQESGKLIYKNVKKVYRSFC